MAEDQNRTLNDKFMLRLPDGMRDRIKAAAKQAGRSMNAEIVATLEDKYPEPPEGLEDFIQRLRDADPELQQKILGALRDVAAGKAPANNIVIDDDGTVRFVDKAP